MWPTPCVLGADHRRERSGAVVVAFRLSQEGSCNAEPRDCSRFSSCPVWGAHPQTQGRLLPTSSRRRSTPAQVPFDRLPPSTWIRPRWLRVPRRRWRSLAPLRVRASSSWAAHRAGARAPARRRCWANAWIFRLPSSRSPAPSRTARPPHRAGCADDDCDGIIDDGELCPCSTDEYAGATYLVCADAADWESASHRCETYGATLVAIDDADENTYLLDRAVAELQDTGAWELIWLAGNDRSSEGAWGWAPDDAPLLYTNWRSFEPNDDGAGEDCMTMLDASQSGQWSDYRCDEALPFACERS